jgi:D-alanyl-lipoteichoic acid acyltransferase DltB (MBOAT superfamily)
VVTAADVDTAVFRIAMGLAKKALIADSIGAVIDPLFAGHASLGLYGAWVAVLGQHFRIYFDFSGTRTSRSGRRCSWASGCPRTSTRPTPPGA